MFPGKLAANARAIRTARAMRRQFARSAAGARQAIRPR